MKKIYTIILTFVCVAVCVPTIVAHAALVPNLTITPVAGGSTSQVTVFGADPNSSVLLYYPSTASLVSANIGTTNSSGYLTTIVDASAHNIAAGANVYVVVNSQASQMMTWPSYTTSGGLALNQSSVTVAVGQSTTVSAAVSASLTVNNNTNASVAGATASGNQLILTAFNPGTTAITVCAQNIGCSILNVTVPTVAASQISLSPSTVNITVGQSQIVSITGTGPFFIPTSNTNNVATNIAGATLTVGGVTPGSVNISVCSSNGSSNSCGNLIVNVAAASGAQPVATTQSQLTFGQSQVNLTVGQTQSVPIYGYQITGDLSVHSNSGTQAVTANVAGASLNLTGVAFGGANIQVCETGGACGTIYAYVAPSGSQQAPQTPTVAMNSTNSANPVLSSFTVSSNGVNDFAGSGSTLTFNFSFNQNISMPILKLGGTNLNLNGSGSGPYTASYRVTGNESLPIAVSLSYTNGNGRIMQAALSIGAGTPGNTAPTASVINAVANNPSSSIFISTLAVGQTGDEVRALQQKLTKLGLYSGPITGKFGYLTQVAVKKFQAAHGLSQAGVVGPATRTLLNE